MPAPLKHLIRERADEIRSALAAAGAQSADLAWNDAMRARAEQARWNGGTAENPNSRHGITAWSEATNQTRWDFDRMRFSSLAPLAAGWQATGEPDYAQAARDYIEGWLACNPNVDSDNMLNQAIRLCLHGAQGWIGTLEYFLDSPAYDDANLLMLFPTAPEGTQFAVHEGERAPFRGWVGTPARDHAYLPAPQLSLTADPMPDYYGQFVTVLVPYKGMNAPAVTAEATPLRGPQDTQPGQVILRWQDGTVDEIVWTSLLQYAIMEHDGIETDAALLHVQRGKDGNVIGGAAINGTYCSSLSEVLLKTPGAWTF